MEQSTSSHRSNPGFTIGQRVHSTGDSRRVGTIKYLGSVRGYPGTWIGVDWDDVEDGKHDGAINNHRYFQANHVKSGSFVRSHNLLPGISLHEALELKYRGKCTKEEQDEMYVYSASNKRVSVQLLGADKIEDKLSRFEELTGVSLSYLGVNSFGVPSQITPTLSKLKELDLTGNLLSNWQDIGIICEQLPVLSNLNLSNNLLSHDTSGMKVLKHLRVMVLNNTGISWTQVEILKHVVPALEELHLMGNKIKEIEVSSSPTFQGFDTLRLLNLDDNCVTDWNEILRISRLKSLEQLYMNKNKLEFISYPCDKMLNDLLKSNEQSEKFSTAFENLSCLLLGGNNIKDLASVDSLNSFPKLKDVRLSENPVTDPGRDGIPRFVQIARLANVEILNGSEISRRERKDSEIRYVRLVLSKLQQESEEDIRRLHPRFEELKRLHGIDDERPSNGAAGPQKMASGLLSITLKCVGASIGEKAPLTKKMPATTTVGKLKILCQSFFKLKSVRPKLFLQEAGFPLPRLLGDEMATLMETGMCNGSILLIDDEEE